MKYDNCKNCESLCEHSGKDREFVCYKGVSCKIPKIQKGNIDLVQVVRCGKCQSFNKTGYEEDNRQQGIPELDFGWCPILHRTMQACNFCSYGERREGE